MRQRLIAGAMSGTSADGVDVAIVSIEGRGLEMSARLIHHEHLPYEPALRDRILNLRQAGSIDLATLAECGRQIALAYAHAVTQALTNSRTPASELTAIAAHGQTLFHRPPNTIQWIDPALLAHETGCTVISDFRRADCAAGGQGAPLVPFGDYILFCHPTTDRAIVNIGGIANITCIPAGATLDMVTAFDTGPGNCISDYLVRSHDPSGPGIDVNGQLASRGTVAADLLEEVKKHPYFTRRGPKSTDGPEMIEAFLSARNRIGRPIHLNDQLATACALTADQILSGLYSFGPDFTGDLLVAGGGVLNQCLMRLLKERVPNLRTTDDFGVPAQVREAIAFAVLGAATLDGVPSNVPSVTGAGRPLVLGSITSVGFGLSAER